VRYFLLRPQILRVHEGNHSICCIWIVTIHSINPGLGFLLSSVTVLYTQKEKLGMSQTYHKVSMNNRSYHRRIQTTYGFMDVPEFPFAGNFKVGIESSRKHARTSQLKSKRATVESDLQSCDDSVPLVAAMMKFSI
jgi:hypothetical protein